MADDDWRQVNSRRERRRAQDDENREERIRAEAPRRSNDTRNLAWFNSSHSPPTWSPEEYDRNHVQLYGEEERMINGKHRWGKPEFPAGSPRDIAHADYSESTRHRDRARKSYLQAAEFHKTDLEQLPLEQQNYYNHATDKLLPAQHADLSVRALDYADASRRNGSQRTDFGDNFPFGQHSLPEAVSHYKSAQRAFQNHKTATKNHTRHERHRSSEIDDGQRDCYNRRVTAGTLPHSRSRNHELPPRGHYSPYLTTPPGPEEEDDAKKGNDAEEEDDAEEEVVDYGRMPTHYRGLEGRGRGPASPYGHRSGRGDRR